MLILAKSLGPIGPEVLEFPGTLGAALEELAEKLVAMSSFESKLPLLVNFKVKRVRFLVRAELEQSRVREGVGDLKGGGVSGDGSRFSELEYSVEVVVCETRTGTGSRMWGTVPLVVSQYGSHASGLILRDDEVWISGGGCRTLSHLLRRKGRGGGTARNKNYDTHQTTHINSPRHDQTGLCCIDTVFTITTTQLLTHSPALRTRDTNILLSRRVSH